MPSVETDVKNVSFYYKEEPVMTGDLGFSREDRLENIRRIAFVAGL